MSEIPKLRARDKEKLARINDIIYSLIFTSVNLTAKQKEMLAEIRELSESSEEIE